MERHIENDEIADMQPALHDQKKFIFETACKCICYNYDLTKNEYKKYNNLKRECLKLFDLNNEDHNKMLDHLYELYGDIETKKDKTWKNLGFQVIYFLILF